MTFPDIESAKNSISNRLSEQKPSVQSVSLDNPVQDSHAARTEILGEMMTGIAHEFNNLLTVVLSSLEQLRRQRLNERGQQQLTRAEWGAQQAGRLARQMLDLASQRTDPSRNVDLNTTVAGFDKILRHVIRDEIRLAVELSPGRLPVLLDPAELELAVLHLARNAADAISGSGSIVIRTAGHRVDGLGGKPTAEVSITDSGDGTSSDIARRANAGFFTTKAPGEGSEPGLWKVQSFVTACEGKVEIETAVGHGTTVRLVFPRVE